MNRRHFTKSAILTPLMMLLRPAAIAQQGSLQPQAEAATPKTPELHKPKTAAAYNQHPPIIEPEPFADKLVFKRRDLERVLQPFTLQQVQLGAGPLQDARHWNRGYILRLSNDRLLHNFRVTAGLPSKAEPLGGWEAPGAELRGHFVGHYLSACHAVCRYQRPADQS